MLPLIVVGAALFFFFRFKTSLNRSREAGLKRYFGVNWFVGRFRYFGCFGIDLALLRRNIPTDLHHFVRGISFPLSVPVAGRDDIIF